MLIENINWRIRHAIFNPNDNIWTRIEDTIIETSYEYHGFSKYRQLYLCSTDSSGRHKNIRSALLFHSKAKPLVTSGIAAHWVSNNMKENIEVRYYQSFVSRIHWWPRDLPHIGPAMQKALIMQFQNGFTIYITERQILLSRDMTWASGYFTYMATSQFVQQPAHKAWKKTRLSPPFWSPVGEPTGDQWNPHTKGQQCEKRSSSWWRQQMQTFSALLDICPGNLPVPVNSPHKGQWRATFMFSLMCAWINRWVNNREAGDLRRHRAHYDVIVMSRITCLQVCHQHYGKTKYTQQWQHVGNLGFHLTGNSIFCPRAHTGKMKQKY